VPLRDTPEALFRSFALYQLGTLVNRLWIYVATTRMMIPYHDFRCPCGKAPFNASVHIPGHQ
jgi:hypothetical protein